MPANVKRPLWSFLLPQTYTSRLHTLAFHAPTIVFLTAICAIVSKQSFYRTNLADEDAVTFDRIDRRAYVALPDGRMALVYPIIDTQTSFSRTVMSFLDAISPFP